MKNKNARHYTRVDFQRDVHLDFEGKKYTHHTVNNLSLGGMYVKGAFDQKKGDVCSVDFSVILITVSALNCVLAVLLSG